MCTNGVAGRIRTYKGYVYDFAPSPDLCYGHSGRSANSTHSHNLIIIKRFCCVNRFSKKIFIIIFIHKYQKETITKKLLDFIMF